MNLLKQATAADDALQMLQVVTAKGWSDYKRDTPMSVQAMLAYPE